MKKEILNLGAFAFIMFATSCAHKYYTANNIDQYNIKTIAVLPVAMEYTGNMPKNMTAADLAKKGETESAMFQRSLHNNILMFMNKKKNPSNVQFQSTSKTVQILASNNISISTSWTEDPVKLAKILGVDAVVKANITTNRYMSDAASGAFSVLNDVLGSVKGNIPIGNAPTKTGDIIATCTLIENKDGNTIWNIKYDEETDWRNQPQEIIDQITRNFGKRFPL